jgi:uroporphyrinogen-III decarboxylase
MGNLSPIDLVLPGSPEQIRAEARRCIGIAREQNGGYLLAPSGAFIPGTPAENIQAILDAGRD